MSWDDSWLTASERKELRENPVVPVSETRAVIEEPTSVTHWTCPESPIPGQTHHIMGDVKCRYCRRYTSELRAEQAEILKKGATK